MWVKKTNSGKIRYCEGYTDYMTGKHKEVSIVYDKDTRANRKEANKILLERIQKATEYKPKEYTLHELIAEYHKDLGLHVKESTFRRNMYALEGAEKILGGDTYVDRMTARYIKQKFLASGKNNTTLNGYLKRIKTLIKWGYKHDLVQSTREIDKVDRFQVPSRKKRIQEKFLEADELQAVLEGMKVEKWRLMTEFLAFSGLRCGEAIALTRKDIDLENKVIHVTKTYDPNNHMATTAKTDSSMDDVIIQDQLEQTIRKINSFMKRQQLLRGYKTKLFFANEKGNYVQYYSFNKYFRENTQAIIGRGLTTHSLRHTHASLLFEQGFTVDEVARRLRHSDSTVTRDIYIHVTKKLREMDAQKLKDVKLI